MSVQSRFRTLALVLARLAAAITPAVGCTTTQGNTVVEGATSVGVMLGEAVAENLTKDDRDEHHNDHDGVDQEEDSYTPAGGCTGNKPSVGNTPAPRDGYRWIPGKVRCVDGAWERIRGRWQRIRSGSHRPTPRPAHRPRPTVKVPCNDPTLYVHAKASGPQLVVKKNVKNLKKKWVRIGITNYPMNDQASYICVPQGYRLTLFEHADYKGKSVTLNGPRHARLTGRRDFNDKASSVKVTLVRDHRGHRKARDHREARNQRDHR